MRKKPLNCDYVCIVSGLPRSGTSMMMNALEAGGMEVLTDHIRQADEDNPRGYYEFEPVKKTREDPSWLREAKGKAVKVIYRLLYDLPKEYRYRVIFMQRNLKETLESQNRMLRRNGRPVDTIPEKKMLTLLAAELSKCERWLAVQPNFNVLYVDYRTMIEDGQKQARKINKFLDGGLDVKAMAAVVDPSLYRNRYRWL